MTTPEARARAARGLLVQPASHRGAIDSFIVMDVMRAASAKEAQGAKVIHMEVGQPGTPAPQAALEAVRRALPRQTLGYTLARSRPSVWS
jgi:aspartate/methionine/tyrosine aminotransferase